MAPTDLLAPLPPTLPLPIPTMPAQPANLPPAPAGVDAALFEKARAALAYQSTNVRHHDVIGLVDYNLRSDKPRFHLIDMMSGAVTSLRVTHGSGSDRAHSGFVQEFSNRQGSMATSNGTYVTAEAYHGKYGLSRRLDGLDITNNAARPRAIVMHHAWYAEPDTLAKLGKLGRSQGCFALAQRDHFLAMERLGDGRMIFADKTV